MIIASIDGHFCGPISDRCDLLWAQLPANHTASIHELDTLISVCRYRIDVFASSSDDRQIYLICRNLIYSWFLVRCCNGRFPIRCYLFELHRQTNPHALSLMGTSISICRFHIDVSSLSSAASNYYTVYILAGHSYFCVPVNIRCVRFELWRQTDLLI